jgi:hypothetical protein
VPTNPVSKLGFVELAGCKGQDKRNDRFLGGFNAEAVQPEEEIHGLEGNALVPINKWMVLGKAKAIGRGERGEVLVSAVVELVLGTF